MQKFLLVLTFACIAFNLQAIDNPIAPKDMQKQLGHGFDVSWAEFSSKIQGYGVDEVLAMKAMGFQTARIRTALPADSALFSYLDRCINDCLNNGIIPIIAHNANAFEQNPSVSNLQSDVQWWDTIAKRYQDYSHKLLFNINIEWSDSAGKDSGIVNNYYRAITPVIRKTNPTRILIFSPIKLSAPEYLNNMSIPTSAGNYVIAEWHFYAAGPSKDSTNKKYWTTGTSAQRKLITDEIKYAINWQTSTGVPTWVGAWMAGNYNDGNDYSAAEQTVFASYMRHVLDSCKVPWAINTIDKFYDYTNNCWLDSMKPVLKALEWDSINSGVVSLATGQNILLSGNSIFFNQNGVYYINVYSPNGAMRVCKKIAGNSFCFSNILLSGIYIVVVRDEKQRVIFTKKSYFQ
jgi:hypothetical protein